MNKKITIISLLAIAVVCPAMAEVNVDITAGTNNPGCNNTVLHTYSGPTQLEAEYSPNTINLKWYGADGEITTVPNASKTCTYDGSITLPTTNPTRTGYTFAGWQVRSTMVTNILASFNMSTMGDIAYGHGWKNNADIYWTKIGSQDTTNSTTASSAFNDIALNEWKTEFSYGTIYGEASCQTLDSGMEYLTNNTNLVETGQMDPYEFIANYTALAGQEKGAILTDIFTRYSNGVITYEELRFEFLTKLYSSDDNTRYNKNTTGPYCFCKVTNFTPINGTKQNVVGTRWAAMVGSSADHCAETCAFNCAYNVSQTDASTRSFLFGLI